MAPKPHDQVKVNLKLKPGSDAGKTITELLRESGVLGATQVFPDETDPDLSGLYLLDLAPAAAKETIGALRRYKQVQYVEPTAPRKLIR
jgi:hypothetical protein